MLRSRIAQAAAVASVVIAASLTTPAVAFMSEADAAATSSVLASDAGWQVAPTDAGRQ
ncbi:hypothetical protein ACICHK_03835 [Streptomyces sp. AHU1]|uniref:hypothetical protein n=1 Tax=Streptomyces sp. AHU1 TaxID=3377215 RepID=UPI0038783302